MQHRLTDIIAQINAAPDAQKLSIDEVMAAHDKSAVTSIRLNTKKNVDEDYTKLIPVPWCSNGKYLIARPSFTLDPLLHGGAYYVQEASSMFVAHAFNTLVPRSDTPLRLLDLCAAPGGKSTLLANLLTEQDLLIANEVIQPRASILAENLSRWGQMNTWVTNNDPADFAKLPNYFDIILIDAPCTGSGLWRKDAAAINEWSVDHVKLCSERQKRILADALPSLKEGGILLYATCSYSREENEDICDWLTENMHLQNLPIPVNSDWNIVQTKSAKQAANGYRFYPWLLQGEGFFLAAFQKVNSDAQEQNSHSKKRKQGKEVRSKQKPTAELWKNWLQNDFHLIEKNEEYYAIPTELKDEYNVLSKLLRIKKTGTALGKIAGKDIIPNHELALSIHLSKEANCVDVDKDTALLFLKKEEILRDNAVKGWQAVKFNNCTIGWGKWLPNRMNNYLPKNLRIRMDISES